MAIACEFGVCLHSVLAASVKRGSLPDLFILLIIIAGGGGGGDVKVCQRGSVNDVMV